MGKAKKTIRLGQPPALADSWVTLVSSEYISTPPTTKRTHRLKQLRGIKTVTLSTRGLEVEFATAMGDTIMNGKMTLPEFIHTDSPIGQAMAHLTELIEDSVKRFEKIS